MASVFIRRAAGWRVAGLLLLLFASQADATRRFTELGAGRGLDVNVAVSMLVDRDGLLWVGSREGLFRYDGYQATAFLPDPERTGSISDQDIRSLHQTDDGALWVSTNTGGLNRRDPQTGQFTQFHHDSRNPRSLSDESIYGVAQDATGRVWVGTQNGLNRLDAEGRNFVRYFHDSGTAASLAHNWVYALHRGASRQLWIGTVGGGIDRWDDAGGRFEHFPLASLLDGARGLDDVFALHEAADGRVWAGTRDGLVVLDPAQRTAKRIDLANDSGSQPLITTMHADQYGRLWIATLAHGVLVVDLATGKSSRAHPGGVGAPGNLPSQPQLSLASNEHTLFVGTWGGGVYRAPLEEAEFRLLAPGTDGGGLRDKNVTAVLGRVSAGQPWVGSFGGGPQLVDVVAGSVAPTGGPTTDSILQSGVLSFAVTRDEKMFAGSTAGVYRFAEDGSNLGLDTYDADRPDGIGQGYVGALLAAEEGGLWVGVGGSGLFLREAGSGRYRAFRHDPQLPDSLSGDYVTALAQGRSGYVWVGTRSNGLNHCRIEPWSCERFDGRSGGDRNLRHHHVTALRRDRAGGLWVATDGGGLHRALVDAAGRVTRFERWGVERGLLNDGIMAVEEDDDGSLWLSTRHGLSRLDPAKGQVVNHVPQFGLPVSSFNTGASSTDSGFVHFGSVQGLVSVPKGTPLQVRPPSPVRITGVERLASGAGQQLSPAELRHGFEKNIDDGLALEFAVLDFAETRHDYAYRLQPQDDWTPLGRRRQVTFFGLAPGHYRFEARGRDVFGQWSTSPPLEFDVVPPFWMTSWFRGLALAAIAMLMLGLHFVRLRSLRQRNAVLEQLESQREQALARAHRSQAELEEAYAGLRQLTGRLESAKEDERIRISRELHDQFGQTLTAAKINLQLLRSTATDSIVARRLQDSVAMVDGMIRQARDIARGLRPPLLDEAGLVPALDHHLKSLAERSGLKIELDAAPEVAGVPQGLNTTVFRVVQEAVSNALRHARATLIRVTLRVESDALRLLIEDDGVGFDPEAVSQRVKRGEHLGLLGMTERVRNAGGTLELDSRPGSGSRLEVMIPFAKPGAGPVPGSVPPS
ncbi:MAG: two-component regulator propeller domain-containing protein [Steroidobacteraceae bacterium]|nr:ATP-binding protein [Steroidobacteraceae bacterium]MBP7013664.1 ATP-binding protein [Steroidobacteraceae bacterium]